MKRFAAVLVLALPACGSAFSAASPGGPLDAAEGGAAAPAPEAAAPRPDAGPTPPEAGPVAADAGVGPESAAAPEAGACSASAAALACSAAPPDAGGGVGVWDGPCACCYGVPADGVCSGRAFVCPAGCTLPPPSNVAGPSGCSDVPAADGSGLLSWCCPAGSPGEPAPAARCD